MSIVVVVEVLSHVQLFATPWTIACLAPLSMGFPRQEYWSGLPFPPLVDLPKRDRTHISCLAGKFFTTEAPQKPMSVITHSRILYILFMVFPKPSNKSLLKFYF